MDYLKKEKLCTLGTMIDSIYKILCTFEESGNFMPMYYLDTVISEIRSANEMFFEGELIHIVIQLNTLKQPENHNHKRVKKVTLDCANTLCRARDVVLNG